MRPPGGDHGSHGPPNPSARPRSNGCTLAGLSHASRRFCSNILCLVRAQGLNFKTWSMVERELFSFFRLFLEFVHDNQTGVHDRPSIRYRTPSDTSGPSGGHQSHPQDPRRAASDRHQPPPPERPWPAERLRMTTIHAAAQGGESSCIKTCFGPSSSLLHVHPFSSPFVDLGIPTCKFSTCN